MLSIQFIGTGAAFDMKRGNSSAILTLNNSHVLIDCGYDTLNALRQKNLDHRISHLLITHLHDDHAGSLGAAIYFLCRTRPESPVTLLYPTPSFRDKLIAYLKFSLGNPERYIAFAPLSSLPGAGFIDTFGKHVPWMQTYAYWFSDGERSIVFSGDLGDPHFLFGKLDALQLPRPVVYHEISFGAKSPSHTHYTELMEYTSRYSIYGYHCEPDNSPADNQIPLVANFPELNF